MPCDSATLLRDATFPVVVEGGTYGDALEACDADGCAVRRLDFVVHRPTCGGACPPASPVAVIIIHAGGYVRNDACADCWSMEVADFFASRGALAVRAWSGALLLVRRRAFNDTFCFFVMLWELSQASHIAFVIPEAKRLMEAQEVNFEAKVCRATHLEASLA